jgi:hypothetical protein
MPDVRLSREAIAVSCLRRRGTWLGSVGLTSECKSYIGIAALAFNLN